MLSHLLAERPPASYFTSLALSFWICILGIILESLSRAGGRIKQGSTSEELDWHLAHYACLCAQSCLTLCDRMDCSPPGPSVHGVSQARILEWVAIFSSRGSSHSRAWAHIFGSLALAGRFFTTLPPRKPLAHCRDQKVFRIVRSRGQQGSHLSRCLPAEGWREQGRSGQGAWEGPSQELRGSWVPLHCGVQRAPFCAFLPPVWRPYHRMPCLNQECSTSRPHRSWKLDDVDCWLLHHQPIRRQPWANHTPWNSLLFPVFKTLFLEAIGEFGFFKH